MTRYILRRLLYLPFGLLLLTLCTFWLMETGPEDPVERRLRVGDRRAAVSAPRAYLSAHRQLAEEMGRDLPPFYFSVLHGGLPDTLHRITPQAHRRTLRTLAGRYGYWPAVQAYYRTLQFCAYDPDQPPAVRTVAQKLLLRPEPAAVQQLMGSLPPGLESPLMEAYRRLTATARPGRVLVPRLVWYGTPNRYHRYLAELVRGSWGRSLADRRPVAAKIATDFPRTVLLNGLALLLIYLLAIPLGMYMAYHAGSRFDRWMTGLLFLGFGIPSFWVATLLANFFTTPAFGMNWFPTMGFGEPPPGAGFWKSLYVQLSHLVLPLICLVYPSLAYVSRHLRSAALIELRKPYVSNAYMQGLSGREVLWGQVFRNASFPLITMLGTLLPALLAGSVLIERIFNIPGMGMLLYEAALASDWPVLTVVILLNGLLTIGGLIVADVVYVLADPRVRLAKPAGR